MATTRRYINHLLQNTGITPACSEEERAAAEDIAHIFARHGFEPEVQEFSASGSKKIVTAVLGIAAFLGAIFIGIGGVLGIVGLILAVVAAVLYTMERMGRPLLSSLGSGGLSQNVIAYHKATGPLASPRNRPVVVVAHYDSPRADILSQMPYALYRPLLAKLLPAAMIAPAVIAVLRLFPFPGAAKTVLWLLAVVAALVPLANAVAIIMNRFILPYTTGSVCNKSSVAAMLGVMNAVAPFQGENEFPADVPFEEYFAEQRRIAEELAAQAAAAAASEQEAAPVDLDWEEGADESGEEPEAATEEAALEQDDVALGQDGADAADVEPDETVSAPVADPGATQAMDMAAIMGDTAVVGAAAGAAESVADAVAASVDEAEQDEALDVRDIASGAPDGEEAPESDSAPVEEDAAPSIVNAAGNYRYGVETLRSLGMVSDACVIEYDMSEPEPAPAAPAPMGAAATSADPLDDEWVASMDEDASALEYEEEPTAEEFADEGGFEEDYEEPYGEAYEDEGLEFSRRGMPLPQVSMATQNTLASTLSAVGEGAARFFGNAFKRGKSALSEIEHAARDAAAKRASAREEARDAEKSAVEESEPLTVDAALLDQTQVAAPVDETEIADEKETASEDVELSAESAAGAVADKDAAEDGATASEEDVEIDAGSTQVFTASEDVEDLGATVASQAPSAPLPGETVAVPALSSQQAALNERASASRPIETVDSLMAQITASRPASSTPVASAPAAQAPAAPARRAPVVVPDPAQPSLYQPAVSNRASLFDLPDPSGPGDPLAPAPTPAPAPSSFEGRSAATAGFSVISSPEPAPPASSVEAFGTISANAPVASSYHAESKRRGGLFHRKKKSEPSMSEYLGVEDDFDAKNSGRSIGSWDNFDDYDDDWKGGATGAPGIDDEQLRDAITSMDDDELLGHDIWFVATGASEYEHAGMQAFLNTHRDKLRGVLPHQPRVRGRGPDRHARYRGRAPGAQGRQAHHEPGAPRLRRVPQRVRCRGDALSLDRFLCRDVHEPALPHHRRRRWPPPCLRAHRRGSGVQRPRGQHRPGR